MKKDKARAINGRKKSSEAWEITGVCHGATDAWLLSLKAHILRMHMNYWSQEIILYIVTTTWILDHIFKDAIQRAYTEKHASYHQTYCLEWWRKHKKPRQLRSVKTL